MMLPKEMSQITYYGMGPVESYADKHRASWHGRFVETVDSLFEDYIFPQENGSHWDVSYVEAAGEDTGLWVVSEKTFSFNASRYTPEKRPFLLTHPNIRRKSLQRRSIIMNWYLPIIRFCA